MIELKRVKTYSVKKRKSKVDSSDFAKKPSKNASFASFFSSLPNILKAKDFQDIVESIRKAKKQKKSVIFMCGAHVIKCGLSPVIIDLMERKIITCLSLNGAGIIHDFEIAFQGRTSEDVASGLATGSFGMAQETADFLNKAISEGVRNGEGLGRSVGAKISQSNLPHKKLSLFSRAHTLNIPACVHIAIGTDIIHQHPSFDASLAAEGSMRDFLTLSQQLIGLHRGGVVLNFGSAVILPEVFVKALNIARNLGNTITDFTTANFDMTYHYRPAQNIVSRPTASGGKGYYIIGHHEIMLPLLAQAVIETL